MEAVEAIVMEEQYIYKPLLLGTRERKCVLYIGVSLKVFIIRSKKDKYKMLTIEVALP